MSITLITILITISVLGTILALLTQNYVAALLWITLIYGDIVTYKLRGTIKEQQDRIKELEAEHDSKTEQ